MSQKPSADLRAHVETVARLMAERDRFIADLRARGGAGNVVLFPPHRRVRSVQEVALLQIGYLPGMEGAA